MQDKKYDAKTIEAKWRAFWDKNPINQPNEQKPKFYCLDMFPYPSASGIHVGHWRGYVLSDALSRYKVLQGFSVLHPMGFDAFGLPAENYAIKEGRHPEGCTNECIASFKKQLKEIGAIYDWNREISTTDPNYYKWTQWIFIQMFKQGLAYEKEMPLNWCPSCNAVLANEEATNGICDRCKTTVTKKNLRQWMLRITKYADRLLSDLEGLAWPEKVKKMQADWIGKSHGAELDFCIANKTQTLKVFTTRPDTLFGATFVVISPEHPLVLDLTEKSQEQSIKDYLFAASTKSSVDRMSAKDKTGVFTGSYAINPLNNENIPIWVSDYVLADYGTGAIMCVPAHDERDFAFAMQFNLPIVQVIAKEKDKPQTLTEAYTGEGFMVNSGQFCGMPSQEAKEAIADYLAERGAAKKTINYKLRDWVFSRQRYWGEPIPLIHCQHCGVVPVPEEDLPVKLPFVESYQPTSTGESPLAQMEEWVNTTCPVCQGKAKRETNTMPQWAGSSWYFLRYADPHNQNALVSPEALHKWLPVDYYVGGIEHAVLHLLYARFYTKFLFDIGVVPFEEPFKQLFNQGMINRNGVKMSKSKGNVVSPDELVSSYGCDALRMYVLFVGPPELDAEWDDKGIEGVSRFLNKTYKLVLENLQKNVPATPKTEQIRHKMIFDITSRLENLTLNTVVSGFMESVNKLMEVEKEQGGIDKKTLETLAILLAPFAPHMAEELWLLLGNKQSVYTQPWPTYDPQKMQLQTIVIVVQINGKVRENIEVSADESEENIRTLAKASVAEKWLTTEPKKVIYVPKKLVNFVV